MSDPLDMNNYRLERLPKMQKSSFEIWMARLGGPLAILAFILIYWFGHFGFIDGITTESVSGKALARLNEIGLPAFIRSNYAMLAIFVPIAMGIAERFGYPVISLAFRSRC